MELPPLLFPWDLMPTYTFLPTAPLKEARDFDSVTHPLANCRLHVVFHGCKQTINDIQEQYVENTGYNKWAESNNIIVYVLCSLFDSYLVCILKPLLALLLPIQTDAGIGKLQMDES